MLRMPLFGKAALVTLLLLGGCGAPSLLITPVSNKNDLKEETVDEGKGLTSKKILVLPVEGMLVNSRGPGLLQPGENQVSLITQQLKKAADDSSVAAVVLRINSPGGTVTSSDTIYELVNSFKKKTHKPIIASTQEVTASGGYYVACAADKIVAQPTSIVGSIGVIFETFDVENTLGKIGVHTYTIKSGELKDMGSPLKPLSPKEREVIQSMIDNYFVRFQGIVTASRKLSQEELGRVNDGRVFTGEQALALKLVDQLGTLDDAIEVARKAAHAEGAKVVLYIRPYGYGGSIYATNQIPAPEAQSNTTRLVIPGFSETTPAGFYYLWQP